MSTTTTSVILTNADRNQTWPIGITASPASHHSEPGQTSTKGNAPKGNPPRRPSNVRKTAFSSISSGHPSGSQSSFLRVSAQTGLVLLPHIDPHPQTMTGRLLDPRPLALATVATTTRPVAVTIPHGIAVTVVSGPGQGDKLTAVEKLALVLVDLDRQRQRRAKKHTAVPTRDDSAVAGDEKSLLEKEESLAYTVQQPELEHERGRPKERATPFRIRSSSTTTAALVERRARLDDTRASRPGRRKRCISSPACMAPFTDRHLPAIAQRRRQEQREAELRLVQSLPLFKRYRLIVEPWLLPADMRGFDRTRLRLPPGVPPIPLHVHVLKAAQKAYGVMSKMFLVAAAGSTRRG